MNTVEVHPEQGCGVSFNQITLFQKLHEITKLKNVLNTYTENLTSLHPRYLSNSNHSAEVISKIAVKENPKKDNVIHTSSFPGRMLICERKKIPHTSKLPQLCSFQWQYQSKGECI